MAFRSVVISNPTDLHVRSGQIVAVQDQSYWIPTEDVAVLVLEDPRIRVSSAAMSIIARQGVAVAVCDDKHMPTAILLPHCEHSRHLAVVRRQLAATVPLKKRLWQALVRAKIENQARCLDLLGIEGAARLRHYASQTKSGDSGGMEGVAARYYFARLMPGAKRHDGNFPNPALDYGYAILRAAVARSLVGHGFYPVIGIGHDSQLNPFNLADDVLEPFRPFVDLLALMEEANPSTKEGRAVLVGVLHLECDFQSRTHSILTAIDSTVASMDKALQARDAALLVTPRLLSGRRTGCLTE